LHQLRKKTAQSILVTSSVPSEGKTFVCYHLAKNLVKRNQKVVFMNLTMEDRVGKMLGVKTKASKYGLSDYFHKDISYDELLISARDENLYYIKRGEEPKNFLELLDSQKMLDLLNYLESYYDVIVMDTPSVLRGGEALMLPKPPDCTIVVVESTRVKKQYLAKTTDRFANTNKSISGFILNKVPKKYMASILSDEISKI